MVTDEADDETDFQWHLPRVAPSRDTPVDIPPAVWQCAIAATCEPSLLVYLYREFLLSR